MHIRRVGTSTVGDRVTFVSGQFAGHTYRAELEELQKADLGRKYARKDRRPLDPPPVVLFRFIELLDADGAGAGESERVVENYDDFKSFGFLCHVDLFPVPPEDGSDLQQAERRSISLNRRAASSSAPYSPVSSSPLTSTSSQYSSAYSTGPPTPYSMLPSHPPSSLSQMAYTLAAPTQAPTPPNIFPMSSLPQSLPPMFSIPAPAPPPPPPPLSLRIPVASSVASHVQITSSRGMNASSAAQPDTVAYAGNYAITESSKCTEALSGATFVQACTLEYKGRKTMMFVFSDLAVKVEGTFCLRYRVFNIFSKAWGDQDVPILAECYGGPFKIYSTKEFPGLQASTELTKHISFFGVRLNLRENERKRRKKSDIEAERKLEAAITADPSSVASQSPTVSSSSADTGLSRKRGVKGKGKSTRRRVKHSSSESDGYTQ